MHASLMRHKALLVLALKRHAQHMLSPVAHSERVFSWLLNEAADDGRDSDERGELLHVATLRHTWNVRT